MNRIQYIAIAAACACSTACGGSKPTPAPDLIATAPKSSAQIVAPASQPAVPTEPDPTTPAAAAPVAPDSTASAPVAASAPAASEPVATAPTPASTPVLSVVFYADDQTQGDVISAYGMLTMTSPTEPTDLQSLLQAKFSDTGLSVVNASTGGSSSSLQNELAGVDGGGQPQPARMVASGAKIAVEAHSLHDYLGGETVEQFQADLIQWVEDAQASGITPVLQEPAPVCDGSDPLQPQYVGVIDGVGQQLNVPVIPLYSYVQSLPDWQTHMQGCQIPDSYLNQLEAQQAQAVIAPLVQKLIGS